MTQNSSGIEPTEFKVLVRPDKVEEKTKGGIVIPEMTRDREQHAATKGTLVAVSPLAFGYEVWPEGAERPRAGDRVAFARYSGIAIKGNDGADYLLIQDKDIAAVLR